MVYNFHLFAFLNLNQWYQSCRFVRICPGILGLSNRFDGCRWWDYQWFILHIGEQPLVSINKTAMSLDGSWGGNKCYRHSSYRPRGSYMEGARINHYSFKKCCRSSLILDPCSIGPPPATANTGLPQVWASIQKWLSHLILQNVIFSISYEVRLLLSNFLFWAEGFWTVLSLKWKVWSFKKNSQHIGIPMAPFPSNIDDWGDFFSSGFKPKSAFLF